MLKLTLRDNEDFYFTIPPCTEERQVRVIVARPKRGERGGNAIDVAIDAPREIGIVRGELVRKARRKAQADDRLNLVQRLKK